MYSSFEVKMILICFLFQLKKKGMTEDRVGRAGSKDMSMIEFFGWKY